MLQHININGKVTSYYLEKQHKCAKHNLKYNKKYEAVYCADCNEWIDPKCSDMKCKFCNNRPEKPLNL